MSSSQGARSVRKNRSSAATREQSPPARKLSDLGAASDDLPLSHTASMDDVLEKNASLRKTAIGSQFTELQLTKKFLSREIEARSRKLSSLLRWRVNRPPEERPEERLFVVSSRLPFTTLLDDETGELSVEHDPFSFDIARLLELRNQDSPTGARGPRVVLVGAPVVRRKSDGSQVFITEAMQENIDSFCRSLNVVPVFWPHNRDHFADFVIFPLFHYSVPSAETGGLLVSDWEGYELVNERFRDAILKEYSRGDVVWINDYPLMLLPKLLRHERPDIIIGFYIHCVFPSSEVYRILPQRVEILKGVLSSNLIGFHNFQYVRRFFTSCTRILGLECTNSGIEACEDAGGTQTRVVAVPLGVHVDPFLDLLGKEEVKDHIQELGDKFGGKHILVAVDRLEEKKGIPHKIMAFHKFLQNDPSWATRCVFVQIVEPVEWAHPGEETDNGDEVRDMHESRAKLLHQAYQMVGECNSKFGSIGHLPIHFMYKEFSRADLAVLFAKAQVMLDTSLRDMLSQSAHEFLCCQREEDCGVLILSEFSGSAQSLRAAALCVNPWDTVAFADCIREALEMEAPDRKELCSYGRKYVNEYTLKHWANNFLDELYTTKNECETERLQIPPQLDHHSLVKTACARNRRVVILGFSGTLLPHSRMVLPRLNSALQTNLRTLAEDPNTQIVVITSYPRQTVAKALGNVRCWIIAEDGACHREPGSDDWHNTISSDEGVSYEWMAPVRDIMDYFTARTPGSKVVETDLSVSWIYPPTQGDHAAIQSKDLLIHLWAGPLTSAPAEAILEPGRVSVRPSGFGKATELEKILHQICCVEAPEKQDVPNEWLRDVCVVCVGDFLMRDEDIYTTLQKFFTEHCETVDDDSRHSPDSRPCLPPLLPSLPPSRATSVNEYAMFERGISSISDEHQHLSGETLDRMAQLESDKSKFDIDQLPKKTPSEPDLQALEAGSPVLTITASQVASERPEVYNEPSLFFCTVSRKVSRAAYHLIDCSDVAFLMAQMARAFRHSGDIETAND